MYETAPGTAPNLARAILCQACGVRVRARELLVDGQWHDFEETLKELTKKVPPGVALRRAETNRLKGGTSQPERVEQPGLERLIHIGKRAVAREALRDNSRIAQVFEIVPKGMSGRRATKIPRRIRIAPSRR